MPNIKPMSDLRNYTAVVSEVSYGNRVYLTRNGHGTCAIIDMQELDELDKQKALNQLLLKLWEAENSAIAEGTIPVDELEKELGVQQFDQAGIFTDCQEKIENKTLRQELTQDCGENNSKKILILLVLSVLVQSVQNSI